jgi:HEAT repeat protein
VVSADGEPEAIIYDRERGELSPGTEAPSIQAMLGAIDDASPRGLTAMLEYGERVECLACIPKLETKLLASDSAEVREIAAWWLRRRPFGYARAAVKMRSTLQDSTNEVHRARAAEALGEFLDPGGAPALTQAATEDAAPEVRLSAVRALGRLNARAGYPALVAAFNDEVPEIRRAALDQVLRVRFFQEHTAIIDKLGDESADVRIRAAQIIGQMQIQAGREGLEDVLAGDDSVPARQAAAWSLGRLGDARPALIAAQENETNDRVLDAINIALRMVR